MIDRRLTLAVTLAFAFLATPSVAEAQRAGTVHRIGCIPGGLLVPRMHQWDTFRQRLRKLGHVEGQNIVLEFRALEREGAPYDGLVADLVRLDVDVIVLRPARVVGPLPRARLRHPLAGSQRFALRTRLGAHSAARAGAARGATRPVTVVCVHE